MVEYLRGLADDVVVNPYGMTLKKEEILELWDGADGIIAGIEPYTAEVLEKAPASLKVITRYGAGYNSVDIEAAGKRGIKVSNTPGVNAPAVADMTLGLMLAIARRIPQYDAKTRKGGWSRYVGVGLTGKTLGILGLGAIGKEVAVRARGFSMNLMAYDPYFDKDFADRLDIKKASIDEIYRDADFITLHVPVLKETEKMINAETLGKMKSSAFLINAARGELVDETALYEALKNNRIAGAALDVFETEPLLESPLYELENIVVTPHLAGHTGQAEYLMGKLSIDNTLAILNGNACKDVVNVNFLK
jgi:D-3-phosphoglycerate dehydrogenase